MSNTHLAFGALVQTEFGRAVVIRPEVRDGHIRVFLEAGITNPWSDIDPRGPKTRADLDIPIEEVSPLGLTCIQARCILSTDE